MLRARVRRRMPELEKGASRALSRSKHCAKNRAVHEADGQEDWELPERM